MPSFDLIKLFEQAFGVKMPEYQITDANKAMLHPDGTQASFNPETLPKGKYGSSPYFNQDALGRYYFMPAKLGDVDLQYPLIRIQGRKQIVETMLTERKGRVIEQISQDNYKIQIRGVMIGHDRNFPEEQIDLLRKLFETNQSIPLRSVLTDIFLAAGDRVVIEELNLPEVKGVEYVKPYELSLIQDSVFELELK